MYRIQSLSVHHEYDRHSYNNDIAIIELDRDVPLDGAVKTVCLPDAGKCVIVSDSYIAFIFLFTFIYTYRAPVIEKVYVCI